MSGALIAGVKDHHAQAELLSLRSKLRALEQRIGLLEHAVPTIISTGGGLLFAGIFAALPAAASYTIPTIVAVDNGTSFTFYVLTQTTAGGAMDWMSTGWRIVY